MPKVLVFLLLFLPLTLAVSSMALLAGATPVAADACLVNTGRMHFDPCAALDTSRIVDARHLNASTKDSA